jgi:hypothetical protein
MCREIKGDYGYHVALRVEKFTEFVDASCEIVGAERPGTAPR